MAASLIVSEATIKSHLHSVSDKLEHRARLQRVSFAHNAVYWVPELDRQRLPAALGTAPGAWWQGSRALAAAALPQLLWTWPAPVCKFCFRLPLGGWSPL